MRLIERHRHYQFFPPPQGQPVVLPSFAISVTPNNGGQGTSVPVTVIGAGFDSTTSFSFGAGITVTNVVIVNAGTATMTLVIDLNAALGFRNLTVTSIVASVPFTAILNNAFTVTFLLDQYPLSGLDWTAMHLLGIATHHRLYWDYGNTEDFYILVMPPVSPKNQLHLVPPTIAQRFYGLFGPTVVYDPFNGSPTHISDVLGN